jgi:SAM-dependent methyltransferase
VSLIYQVMYRVGFTPWDNDEVPAELVALVEGADALPAGRALDIGCGTGTQAVHLARAGWSVTGIDVVEKPLGKARRRATAAGVAVDWIRADVTRLPELGLAPGFSLLHDRGCYHGMSGAAPPGPMRDVPRFWYRFARRA